MFCRLGDHSLYDKCMSISIDIDLKNNINFWKEVDSDVDNQTLKE